MRTGFAIRVRMPDSAEIYLKLQPRLLGAAYRMLGALTEAEDVVQDVWERWHDTDTGRVDNHEAWLMAATTRRAIDRLRQARTEREKYTGIWLPEPVLTDGPATPEQLQETSSDLSLAFLTVLERLAPDARAAFLLHDVFDADYAEIAGILGKTEAACRQIVHRARSQVRAERPRYMVSDDAHRRLMRRFVDALTTHDFAGLKNLLAESAELIGDGGGFVTSFAEPTIGGQRIAQLLYAADLVPERQVRLELAIINGRQGVLRYMFGELESAQSYDTDGERILRIYVQRNPHKLKRIAALRTVALR